MKNASHYKKILNLICIQKLTDELSFPDLEFFRIVVIYVVSKPR